jgi:hypothetical protein
MVVAKQGRAALVIIVYRWHIMNHNQSSANGKESECQKMKHGHASSGHFAFGNASPLSLHFSLLIS